MKLTFPAFDNSELANLKECLDSGWVTQGPFVTKFEDIIKSCHKVNTALATTSCTAALHLATLALNLLPGDEVLVPAFTWVTSAHCIEYVGAKAVFVDVDPATFNIDASKIEQAINEKTKAIVVVHLFGLAANMDEINVIANKYNLKVIEDAACAIGTTYKGRPVGGIGDIGCFSFHPRKLITTGEGGAVTTNDKNIAEKVAIFRNHGATPSESSSAQEVKPWTMGSFDHLGYNLRLSDIQASVGVAQFKKLDRLLKERREAALYYSELLCIVDEIIVPTDAKTNADMSGHNFQSYVIRATSGSSLRNQIMKHLQANGIQTRPGTHAVHRLGYYKGKYSLDENAFPIASQSEDTTVTLPLFPGMQKEQIELVVNNIKDAIYSGTK